MSLWSDIRARFESHIFPEPMSGCWLWTGQLSYCGYGRIGYNNKHFGAHRIAVELYTGKPIPPGLVVCHRCDNRACVNPDHLYVGTQRQNVEDAKRRNRMHRWNGKRRGEKNCAARLKDEFIPDIRRRLRNGETHRSIAKIYGVSPVTITNINLGISWTHV